MDSNEDKEIEIILSSQQQENVGRNDMSEAGPSSKRAKISSSTNQKKKNSPVEEIINLSSDGFISFENGSAPSTSNKRRDIRNTFDEVRSSAAVNAQKQEQERLKRLEQQKKNAPSFDSYMPVIVNDQDVIQIDSEDEEDDDLECIGVFNNPQAQVKANGYPYRVPPPMPAGWLPSNVQQGYHHPQYPSTSNNIGPLYVDARTQKINQARADEEQRIKKQDSRNIDLESVELTPQGRLLVNLGKSDEDPDVFVAPHLTHVLKPHQLGGIRFMYENIIESVAGYDERPGYGCVLAHSMGLGKTLQVIEFVDIFFRTVQAKHVLIICPINVIQNWMSEFDTWLPQDIQGNPVRNFKIFLLGDAVKSFDSRRDMILEWRRKGGVLLMGYDMFRIFLISDNAKQNKTTQNGDTKKVLKRPAGSKVVTGVEISSTKFNDIKRIREALADPGPDLIICDEGHKIKSLKTSVTAALTQVKTRRRIVLTGYPLQNNLLEYYSMVDFVRPSYLGTKKEFSAIYDRPIKNGQCVDSTANDKKLAQKKIHVLTQLLRGFVQRRSAHLLKKILPENKEYVLILRKTPMQHKLYRSFVHYTKVEMYTQKTKYYNPLKAYAIGTKIWNHPDLLYYAHERQKNPNGSDPVNGFQSTQGNLLSATCDKMRLLQTNMDDFVRIFPSTSTNKSTTASSSSSNRRQNSEVIDPDDADVDELEIGGEISYDWAMKDLFGYECDKIENSNKFVFAFELLKETVARGEKMLLFSSSLVTLNLIENILNSAEIDLEMKDEKGENIKWRRGLNYSRFDGSTPAIEREKLINRFNTASIQKLFLISTRAGSLGINLVSANRVIIFDASWNPCHDAQAVCRIYRYGQKKKTFVYRLIMHNSMERAIFYRQISKHGLQQKVVDELQVSANVTSKQLEDLLQYDEALDVKTKKLDPNKWNVEDDVLKAVSHKFSHLIAEEPFLHESMIHETEDKLSEQERFEAELLAKMERGEIEPQRFGPTVLPYVPGSVNIGPRPDYDAMVREYNQHSAAYRGSLNALQRGVEYSELGLNPLQYKISDQNGAPAAMFPPSQPAITHPLHAKNSGSLYRMNNSSFTRDSATSKVVKTIDEDITLRTMDGRWSKLLKGEQVEIMRMSGKIWIRKTVNGNEILDATNTKYDPRNNPIELVELD